MEHANLLKEKEGYAAPLIQITSISNLGDALEGVARRAANASLDSVAREGLPPYYRAADLFLFFSETETQGLVLAEAHACALPAVAVRASGVDEVVKDGETGLLTKSDAQELADAAIGLLLDADRRLGMGRAARDLAERDFSATRQVEVMAGLYRRLLSGVA